MALVYFNTKIRGVRYHNADLKSETLRKLYQYCTTYCEIVLMAFVVLQLNLKAKLRQGTLS